MRNTKKANHTRLRPVPRATWSLLAAASKDAERLLSMFEKSGQLDLSADPTLRNLRVAIAYAEEQS